MKGLKHILPAGTDCKLTNGGNLLVRIGGRGMPYRFITPSGKFIRFASPNEEEWLNQEALPIKLGREVETPVATKWVELGSVTSEDYSQFKERFSISRESYSLSIETIFFGRMVGGEMQVRRLSVHKSSSDFKYCEMIGHYFQGDWGTMNFHNVEGGFFLNADMNGEQEEYVPLENVAQPSSLQEFMTAHDAYHPSRGVVAQAVDVCGAGWKEEYKWDELHVSLTQLLNRVRAVQELGGEKYTAFNIFGRGIAKAILDRRVTRKDIRRKK